jgi:hypothetical protein
MQRYYEEDRLQCSAITQQKKRCTRIGTHSNGGSVLCDSHQRELLKKKANDAPIIRHGIPNTVLLSSKESK